MQTNKLFFVLSFVGLLMSSCIERFFPDSETDFAPKLVIQGTITTDEGEQEIVISESTTPEFPKFVGVSGCKVQVEDDQRNLFSFYEGSIKGHYLGVINDYNIAIGSSYRLLVQTPDGKAYQSKYEELLPCPVVDSVYYERDSKKTKDPQIDEDGLQFYMNFNANTNFGPYYRFQLVETWEYHSQWPLDKWLDWDGSHDLAKPDYSNSICYDTDSLGAIYVLSTEGLSGNSYSKFKLHFVNDHTQRLMHKYSLLVRQLSLTKSAFTYWENLKKNNQDEIDIFGRQPANVKGNIYNVKDTTEVVLGYFGVSSVRSKRIMIEKVKDLSFDQVFRCRALVISGRLPDDERPIYFATDLDAEGVPYLGLAGAECIFCQLLGGTTEKPSYWDE